MKRVAFAVAVTVALVACSSSHASSASKSTTVPRNETTINAGQETQRTTPSSAGYFQVAAIGGRTSASSRCHTLPTTLDCVRLGRELGTTADLVKFGQPNRNSDGYWVVAIRISQRLTNNMNRHLHQPLAFIVDGTVEQIVNLAVPIHAPEFAINVGPEQAAAVTLMRQLQNLRGSG